VGFSSSLDWSLVYGIPGPNLASSLLVSEGEFLLHRTDTPDVTENFGLAGMVLKRVDSQPIKGVDRVGLSSGFCHVVLFGGLSEAPLNVTQPPSAVGVVGPLYDLAMGGTVAGCGGEEPSLRLVNVNNKGEVIDPYCQAVLGKASGGQSAINAVSVNGDEIFFTTNANKAEKGNCDALTGLTVPSNPAVLFVRVAGERTLQVSAPAAGCAGLCHSAVQRRAAFEGASEDGSRVFFLTPQPLVSGDMDEKEDLYMATIGCPGGETEVCEAAQRRVTSLVQVSHDQHAGQAAEVQGVVAAAPDGRRVYFVARGVLSDVANARGEQAAVGADNLYVYDSASGSMVFIADLCSGPELSGVVGDVRCPLDLDEKTRNDQRLWSSGGARTTGGDGGFLVFSSYGQLVTTGPQADTDNASDVYRYDAESSALDRVSVGEAGYHLNGNGSDSTVENADATIRARAGRVISEDGSRIVFMSTEPLSSAVSNGLVNAYEWHKEPGWSEGKVSLVSTGSDEEGVSDVVITPSGGDVFFVTAQGLVAQDTDGAPDVYDAHICTPSAPCFPSPPAELEPCSGDACQGPLTNPAPLLVPGSFSRTPGENLVQPAKAKPKKKVTKKRAKRKRKVSARKARRRAGGAARGARR
jgi:hypothetical protein